jgi:hypothetical protein
MGTWTGRTWVDTDSGKVYLSCVDTAKLIRKALKRAFPSTKFSVRSDQYSMGASIHVGWTDGPTKNDVEKVVGCFAGSRFDGMIDLKIAVEHWLNPDGTVALARGGGQGSTLPEIIGDPPGPNAQLVHFGADYVFCERRISPERRSELQTEIEEFVSETFATEEREQWRIELPVAVWREGGTLYRNEHQTESLAVLIARLHDARSYSDD